MKIFDCTTFYSEDLMMDVRFNVLNEYVHKFIVVESKFSHSGNKKKLNFDIKKFSKFKNKIDYLVIEDLPKKVENFKKDWESAHLRDQFQRNSLQRGYKESDDEDLIMISDIDEIPDPKKISEFNKKNHCACFMQKNFQSKINLINITDKYWMGTKICQKKYLKNPQWLRNIKTKKRPFWKVYKPKEPQLIFDGGWHFSFLKKPEGIKTKINSYSHQEFNSEKFTNIRNIEEKISKGVDLFERDIKYQRVNVDESFPDYINNNKEKFKDWII